jgi:hypothetical protein
MKLIIFVIVITCTILLVPSCVLKRKLLNERKEHNSYVKYLSEVINDTSFYEIPELKIVDTSICPILDSIILWSEKCNYFDSRIKYLYSFRFAARQDSGKMLYFIDAHKSTANALHLEDSAGKKRVGNVGIFYYRHFLFVVPKGSYWEQKDLEYFPFFMQTGNKMKIRAQKFIDEKNYASYISFIKVNDQYKIREREICGGVILIR